MSKMLDLVAIGSKYPREKKLEKETYDKMKYTLF